MTFSIPAHKCGLVIGRGGENVKAINQQTGAFVEISRQLPPNGDPNFKLFIIRGSPQQIDHAKQLIEEKIEVTCLSRWEKNDDHISGLIFLKGIIELITSGMEFCNPAVLIPVMRARNRAATIIHTIKGK